MTAERVRSFYINSYMQSFSHKKNIVYLRRRNILPKKELPQMIVMANRQWIAQSRRCVNYESRSMKWYLYKFVIAFTAFSITLREHISSHV